MDRAQPGQRHADSDACHPVLGQRRVHDPIVTESLEETFRGADETLKIVHPLTDHDDARVPFHLLGGRFTNRLRAGDRSVHANTSVKSSPGSGNGLLSAKANASAISASTSFSMRSRVAGAIIWPMRLT